MDCPICNTFIELDECEWIDEFEVVYPVLCDKCGWSGSLSCNEEDETESIWDNRTGKSIPEDEAALAAWREENAQYYKA